MKVVIAVACVGAWIDPDFGHHSGQPEFCPISNRNHCPICPGIGVRFELDSVSEMNRNRCPNCPGVRSNPARPNNASPRPLVVSLYLLGWVLTAPMGLPEFVFPWSVQRTFRDRIPPRAPCPRLLPPRPCAKARSPVGRCTWPGMESATDLQDRNTSPWTALGRRMHPLQSLA